MKTREAIVDLVKETTRNHKNSFIRIFPTRKYQKYEKFLEHSLNWTVYRQLYGFLFANKHLLQGARTDRSSSPEKSKYRFQAGPLAPSSGSTTPTRQRYDNANSTATTTAPRGDSVEPDATEEIVLTGDDLVVEYVARLVDTLKDRPDLPA